MSRIFTVASAAICLLAGAMGLMVFTVEGAEGAAGLIATNKADEAVSPETRNLLQLQEQLRATQLALEHNRKESIENAIQTTEALSTGMKATTELSARMKALENSLNSQRARELDVMQSSNRTMLIVAGTFASAGFLALLMMGYFQWRTVSRLAEISAILPPAGLPLPGQRPRAALTAGESMVSAPAPGQSGNSDLLQTIAQLEKRIRELEHGTTAHAANGHIAPEEPSAVGVQDANPETLVSGNGASENEESPDAIVKDSADSEEVDRLTVLLGKGQSLLNADKAEEALACFEEALTIETANTEALVKKGAALERLRRLNEAIECYDRAIEADSTMTIAYLYKGGLCNRLERFNEALQCYEQALRTQEKRAA